MGDGLSGAGLASGWHNDPGETEHEPTTAPQLVGDRAWRPSDLDRVRHRRGDAPNDVISRAGTA
jgi:hypothetical protein